MLTKDETMESLVRKIREEANEWVGIVEGLGNQDAYTDRIIELIIKNASELSVIYDA